MIIEEQRYIHEDLERLEQGIADRISDAPPKHIRDCLNRDHEVAQLLDQIRVQSSNLLTIYQDASGSRARELAGLDSHDDDPFDSFYANLRDIRDHHARYPNEQAENSELRYKPRKNYHDGDDSALAMMMGLGGGSTGGGGMPYLVDSMFSGEEAFGRFFDLHSCHEAYLNLPTVKRLSYLQYLDVFDSFSPSGAPSSSTTTTTAPAPGGGLKRGDKLTDQYFRYAGMLADYLEDFMRRTRPLENVDGTLAALDAEFEAQWDKDAVEGWKSEENDSTTTSYSATADSAAATTTTMTQEQAAAGRTYCPDCEREFKNENVYRGHLGGRKHARAAEQRKARLADAGETVVTLSGGGDGGAARKVSATRLKEHAIAKRENRVRRLAAAMSAERADTRVNVERKQGMTERERQQELEALLNLSGAGGGDAGGMYFPGGGGRNRRTLGENGEMIMGGGRGDGDDDDDDDGDDKVYNPLKLPLAWDGKPIPFWLWRLHGLGVEFPCEICGNFVYMGRRAFDKHFNEPRHIYGLKCLGISQTNLFRDITQIEQALRLWEKIQGDRNRARVDDGSVVQMEDADGNVMPEKVYYDLQKQGLL